MPKPLHETAAISEAAAAAAKRSGRMLMQFISPGWGSSGYYSKTVLESAAKDRVIPAGTHMYADHPTDVEAHERPGRSIKDLMAVTTEDARLSTDGALVGEVQVVPQWRELVETVKDSIGVSIRGSATDIVEGEAEGKRGGIIEGLVAPVMSVDFVTRAGRGGRVLSVLESAAANRRALGHGISEATVNDTREALQQVLRETYGGEKTYVWVRDFDDTTVWFEVEDGEGSGLYAQGYTQAANGTVDLVDEWTEVRVVTSYVPIDTSATEDVPVTRPDSTNPTTTESLEDNMAKIQIEESEHRSLVETAGRVPTLESELSTEKARGDKAEQALAQRDRTDRAKELIGESGHTFDVLQTRGLLADLPVKEGALDEEAFKTAVTEAATQITGGSEGGTVHGFEASAKTPGGGVTESRRTTNAWGRPLAEQKGA